MMVTEQCSVSKDVLLCTKILSKIVIQCDVLQNQHLFIFLYTFTSVSKRYSICLSTSFVASSVLVILLGFKTNSDF